MSEKLLETTDTLYCSTLVCMIVLSEIMGRDIANTISGVTLTKQDIANMAISDFVKQANLNKKG